MCTDIDLLPLDKKQLSIAVVRSGRLAVRPSRCMSSCSSGASCTCVRLRACSNNQHSTERWCVQIWIRCRQTKSSCRLQMPARAGWQSGRCAACPAAAPGLPALASGSEHAAITSTAQSTGVYRYRFAAAGQKAAVDCSCQIGQTSCQTVPLHVRLQLRGFLHSRQAQSMQQ